jgi:uncharacterized integral membrane protein
MKFLSWIITIPVVVFCALFAVGNRQEVVIDLWPTGYVLTTPLWLISLGGAALGFLLGALLFWMLGLGVRLQRHHLSKEVDKLKRELAEVKGKTSSALTPFGQ